LDMEIQLPVNQSCCWIASNDGLLRPWWRQRNKAILIPNQFASGSVMVR
jgi:hypothetical protein